VRVGFSHGEAIECQVPLRVARRRTPDRLKGGGDPVPFLRIAAPNSPPGPTHSSSFLPGFFRSSQAISPSAFNADSEGLSFNPCSGDETLPTRIVAHQREIDALDLSSEYVSVLRRGNSPQNQNRPARIPRKDVPAVRHSGADSSYCEAFLTCQTLRKCDRIDQDDDLDWRFSRSSPAIEARNERTF